MNTVAHFNFYQETHRSVCTVTKIEYCKVTGRQVFVESKEIYKMPELIAQLDKAEMECESKTAQYLMEQMYREGKLYI